MSINYNELSFGMQFATTVPSQLKELQNEKVFHLNAVCTEFG